MYKSLLAALLMSKIGLSSLGSGSGLDSLSTGLPSSSSGGLGSLLGGLEGSSTGSGLGSLSAGLSSGSTSPLSGKPLSGISIHCGRCTDEPAGFMARRF